MEEATQAAATENNTEHPEQTPLERRQAMEPTKRPSPDRGDIR